MLIDLECALKLVQRIFIPFSNLLQLFDARAVSLQHLKIQIEFSVSKKNIENKIIFGVLNTRPMEDFVKFK